MAISLAATLAGQAPVAFERDVLPALEQRCFSCHRAAYRDDNGRLRRPKGDLRLDGSWWIDRGGAGGAIIVPGSAADSPLYQRVVLPEDDDDKMPQRGDPMTAVEIAALRGWIDGGADFGGWVGEPGPADAPVAAEPTATPARVAVLQRLATGVAPAAAAAIEQAAANVARITPALPGSPLLRVAFSGREATVDTAALERLRPLAARITELDLARTPVDGKAVAFAAGLPRLTRLDLRATGIGDGDLAPLGQARELRYLNLYGTEVTDRGLTALAEIETLESLYLWRTAVTAAGVAALCEQRPGLHVHWRLELPPSDDVPAERPARRR